MKLDYKKMLQEIDELVQDDFCLQMETESNLKSPKFTTEDSKKMARKICDVYVIAHSIHCAFCDKKYRI